MNVEIAQRLAELRRKNGYSQESLAEKLGLSRQAISKWERAESSPDTDNLIALARLYGVSLDGLLAIEPTIANDIAFEATDRATQAQAGAAASTPPPFQPIPPTPPSQQASCWGVDADGCHLNSNGQPYRRKSHLGTFPFPLAVVVIYLTIGLIFREWIWTWPLFLTIPFYYWIVKVVEDGLNKGN
jgi:transcriptional regulator with XRE-family HTH domain